MHLRRTLQSRREEIIHAYVTTLREEGSVPLDLPTHQVIDDLNLYLDEVVAALRDEPESTAHDDATSRSPAGLAHGAQRWLIGIPIDTLVREYGILRDCIVASIKAEGAPVAVDEWNTLSRCLTVGIADAIREYARRQEAEAVRGREEAIAAVAHDLRGPLNVVHGYAEVLEQLALDRAALDPARVATMARAIGRASERMTRLITDLLDLSRFEAGHPELRWGVESPGALAAEAIEAIEPLATARGLSLRSEVATDEPVRCDRERVLQALGNFLGNALKFAPTGSAVSVEVTRAPGAVRFAVRDAGPGIPAAQLPRVFDRYWTAPGERRGTGLGLAIVRGIVEAHGGAVSAESAVGKGSVFAFSLPTAAPGAPADG
jgi:signal transduction histidine kinase